jgi:hypothetical protein
MVIVSLNGKFYIIILNFKKRGLGVVHEAWSIGLRTFERGSLSFKGNSITIKHANFFCYRA